jgi:hypothetical protein
VSPADGAEHAPGLTAADAGVSVSHTRPVLPAAAAPHTVAAAVTFGNG